MKKYIFLLACTVIIVSGNLFGQVNGANEEKPVSGSMNVTSSADIYDLLVKWAWEYNQQFPQQKINIIKMTDSGKETSSVNGCNIGFITDDQEVNQNTDPFWKIVVGHNVIVPVINSSNPYLTELATKGVSPAAFAGIFEKTGNMNWNTLLKNGSNTAINYYYTQDLFLNNKIAAFLNISPSSVPGIKAVDGKELVMAVRKDPLAIGFCKLTDMIDNNSQNFTEGIMLLPIDKNANGKIDYMEEIYGNLNAFTRGVWVGKYPKALCSNIYCVASATPENELETAFLYWVLTDGQKTLNKNGYSHLVLSERQSQLDKLNNTLISSIPVQDNSGMRTGLIIASILIGGLILFGIVRSIILRKPAVAISAPSVVGVLDENSINIPKGLYFDKTHTWAFMDENGIVKVGIDDFLQHITGKITRVEMINPGDKITKGEKFLTIVQNGKRLNIYAPVSGTIIAQNKDLESNSSIINTSPFSSGWIYKIEPVNWSKEIEFMKMIEKYREWLKNEFIRLKDFIALHVSNSNPAYAPVILQDGGEIKDNLLSELSPEMWEDFQTNFIDNAK